MSTSITSRAIVRFDMIQALAPLIFSDTTPRGTPLHPGLQVIEIEPHPRGGCVLACTTGHCLVILHDASGSFAGMTQSWHVPVKQLTALLKVGSNRRKAVVGTTWCDLGGSLMTSSYARLVQADRSSDVLAGGGTELGCVDDTETKRPIREDGAFPDWRPVASRSKPTGQGPAAWLDASYLASLATLAMALGGTRRSDNVPMVAQAVEEGSHIRVTFNGLPHLLIILMPCDYPSGLAPEIPDHNPFWVKELFSTNLLDALTAE